MSRSRTRAKKQALNSVAALLKVCINCGRPGRHYVPPSLGDAGFFACESFAQSPGSSPETP